MTGAAQRGLILHMSVSLDGFVAHPDGVIDWHADQGTGGVDLGARRHRANLELLGQVGTIVMGSGGYVDFEKGWAGSDNPMAKLMNGLPKVVFSQSLTEEGHGDQQSGDRANHPRSRPWSRAPASPTPWRCGWARR
jgi:hypothetical protein